MQRRVHNVSRKKKTITNPKRRKRKCWMKMSAKMTCQSFYHSWSQWSQLIKKHNLLRNFFTLPLNQIEGGPSVCLWRIFFRFVISRIFLSSTSNLPYLSTIKSEKWIYGIFFLNSKSSLWYVSYVMGKLIPDYGFMCDIMMPLSEFVYIRTCCVMPK